MLPESWNSFVSRIQPEGSEAVNEGKDSEEIESYRYRSVH